MARRVQLSRGRPSLPRLALLALTGAAMLAGCSTQRSGGGFGSGVVAGTSPLQSVERFLAAVNARDLENMASLFGTRDGPVEGERVEVEIRMDAIATLLQHQRYEIVSERSVPGRESPTTRVGVTLSIDGQSYPDVAFVTVRTPEGRWMVQEIDLERVTGR